MKQRTCLDLPAIMGVTQATSLRGCPNSRCMAGKGALMDWVTIDFEASCLPRHGRSFPIEVAVSGPSGTAAWLIKPHPTWRDWDWTEEAFNLHGISREELDRNGLEPRVVMANLVRAIGSARVIADSVIDRQWMTTLHDVAPAPPASDLRIDHVGTLFDEIGVTHEQIMAAQQHADALCPARHRAGADARWLRTLIDALIPAPAVPEPWLADMPCFTLPTAFRHGATPPAFA